MTSSLAEEHGVVPRGGGRAVSVYTSFVLHCEGGGPSIATATVSVTGRGAPPFA